MRIPRSLIALTVLNSVLLLVLLLQQFHPAFADNEPPVLRGRGLQIVDSQGRIRASISVLEPENVNVSEQPPTVLVQLITERGRPTLKMSASEATSGLSLAGSTDTKGTFAILEVNGNTSSLKLHSEDGHQKVVSPER